MGWFAIEPPPAKLYHYTSAKGFKGIVESNRLWASSIYYLNDASELQYGCDLLHQSLKKAFDALMDPGFEVGKAVLRRCLDTFHNPIEHYPDVYVCCFCESEDVLSMWRTYGVQGGFAIEFSLVRERIFQLAPPSGGELFLRRVDYDRQSQELKLDTACKKFVDMLRSLDQFLNPWIRTHPLEETGIASMVYFFQEILVSILPSLKHPAFRDENEWRAIIRKSRATGAADDQWKLNFRTSELGLIPYFEISPDTLYGTLPITKVVCGPSPNPQLAQNSARLLLSGNFYTVAIEGSGIPARM
jgi:hypothetical protein